MNLKAKWRNKKFKVLVDSRVIRNYILLLVVSRLGILYREKERPYLLVTILGDPILYKDSII